MATMLGFVATDAVIAPGAAAARWCARPPMRRFNRITIDGDTSTNDSFVLIATQPGRPCADHRSWSQADGRAAARRA